MPPVAVRILSVVGLAVAAASCGGPAIDLKKDLEMVDVSSGWLDAGIVQGGKNKLVAGLTLRLRNRGAHQVRGVQLNVVFWVVDKERELGASFVSAIGSPGLRPGETTPPMAIRSELGYVGELDETGTPQSRAQMLRNRGFKDGLAEVFAKRGSRQWTKLGEFVITRRLGMQ